MTLERFEIVNGNDSPDKAAIIGIAESDHYSPDRILEGQAVSSITRWGDTVLLEAHQAGQKISRKDPSVRSLGLPRRVRISGWEDMEAYYLAIVLNLKTTILAEQSQKYARQALELVDAGDLIGARGIINKGKRVMEATRRIEAVGEKTLPRRNSSLLESVRFLRKRCPRKKVVVIAGAKHFSPTDSPETTQGLQTDSFSILQLKETTPSSFSESVKGDYARELYHQHLALYKTARDQNRRKRHK